MKKIFLNEYTSEEIENGLKNRSIDKAIVVFGSCESHGNHLPLGTDAFLAERIAKKVAEESKGTVLVPTIPFGTSIHYDKFPLSITLEYKTLIKIAEEIISSLIKHGLEKIIVMNGHDGNIPALEIACRNVKQKNPQVKILYSGGWFLYSSTKMREKFLYNGGRGHGGEGETSLALYTHPHLVSMDKTEVKIIKEIDNINQYGVQMITDIGELTNKGTTGNSKVANLELGELIFKEYTNYILSLISELDKVNWSYDIP